MLPDSIREEEVPQELVTVAGDVFVEQFRPVDWKRESVYGEQVAVYRSAASADALRTESPGGAAFLTHLLRQAGVDVQALLPIRQDWDVALGLSPAPTDQPAKTRLSLIRYSSPSRLNRIESLYVQAGDSRWRLEARIDELHEQPPTQQPAVEPSSVVVIDDYGRKALTTPIGDALAQLGARTVVINAQVSNKQFYSRLIKAGGTSVIICSEREALKWSGVTEPPTRFPAGSIMDHKELIRLIASNVIDALPNIGHIIINRSGPPFTSVYVRCAKQADEGHSIASYSEFGAPQTTRLDSTPGVETYFLAALVRSLLSAPDDVRRAVSDGVRAVSAYETAHVALKPDYFGRREDLPSAQLTNGVTASFVMSFAAGKPEEPDTASSFLRRAQIFGRLDQPQSALPDYYAPKKLDTEIRDLLRALAAYGQKASSRPFNVLLNAEPGSGKSYFAQCLARHLDRTATEHGAASGQHPLIETNLSSAPEPDQMERTLLDLYETIRDHRAVGRSPVVLIDEFDTLLASTITTKTGTSPMDWLFGQMLAPLWDGAFFVNGRRRQLGGFILLIAVSSKKFAEALSKEGKARDFDSRLDVRLHLSKALPTEATQEQNVLVAVAMLRKHFGKATTRVQLAVLDAIARGQYDGGNREIDRLIMMSARPVSGTFAVSNLPPAELMKHLHVDIVSSVQRYGDSFIEL